jgi:SNF2 family DNA or RNA helicase
MQLDLQGDTFTLTDDSGAPSVILDGRHRIFFSIQLNSTPTDEGAGWSIPAGDSLASTYHAIVSYLTEQSFEYEILDGAQAIRDSLRRQQQIYGDARRDALDVKDSEEVVHVHPPNFVRDLKEHQMYTTRHLLSAVHGANFSVPGSGKTAVVYAAYDFLREEGIVDGILIVGPPSCFMAWEGEYEKCFGQPPSNIRISGRDPEERQRIYEEQATYEILLTTYQTAHRDVEYLIDLARSRSLLIVLDESHYVKRMEGGLYAESVLRIASNATRRVVLTGTPMPHSPKDLWTQITFLWPGREVLGTRREFELHCRDLDAVGEEIRPFFIRVRKRDLDLPEPAYHVENVAMSEHQKAIYQALTVRTLTELELAPRERQELRRWRRGKMIRLLQAASNPTLLTLYSDEFRMPPLEPEGESILDLIEMYPEFEVPVKVNRAAEIARRLVNSGRKVLIWTWFVHNITMLQSVLSDLTPLPIHGGIPRDENINEEFNRERIIQTFLSSPDHNVLVANPAACGESISLHTACHDAIYLDRTFNCGQYLQSLDRIHRIGLAPTDSINYYILVCTDTIDEVVRERLDEKERQMMQVIDEELPLLAMEVETEDVSDARIDEDFERVVQSLRRFIENG